MDAKQTILGNLRKKQSSSVPDGTAIHFQPKQITQKAEHFKKAALATSSECFEIKQIDEIVPIISQKMGGEGALRCWPEFNQLDWSTANIKINNGSAEKSDLFGLTAVNMGIATTGTMILIAAKERLQSVAVLPPHHFALIKRSQIEPTLIDAMQKLSKDADKYASQIVFISGPSRTADIEQTLILGAHGPLKVTIFLLLD